MDYNTLNHPNQFTHSHLKILQINLGRGLNAQHEFLDYFISNEYDIALVSEPYVGKNNCVKNTPGLLLYQFPGNDRTKACIFVKSGLGASLGVAQYSSPNLCVVQFTSAGRRLFLTSVYIEPEVDDACTLNRIERFLQANKNSLHVVGGDFNGWHPLWGSSRINSRGRDVVALTIANDLTVCNVGTTPTFETVTHGVSRSSIIDLTLASENVAGKIDNWHINYDVTTQSEHNAIDFTLTLLKKQLHKNKSQSTYKYNTKKVNWEHFKSKLESNMQRKNLLTSNISEMTNDQLEKYISDITNTIQVTCDETLPSKRAPQHKNPWWNAELESLKREVIRLHHKIRDLKKRGMPLEDAISMRDAVKKKYVAALSMESTDSFRTFCTRQGKEDVWSLTNRLLKSGPQRQPPATLRIDGNRHTTSSRDTAAALLKKFYPDDTPDVSEEQEQIRAQSTTIPDTADEPPFTADEVLGCLKAMNSSKAPGPDHLTADICYKFGQYYTDVLTGIMNRCLSNSFFPKTWKIAFVKTLPKPSKDDYTDLASYRPIGLINVMGKLLEKLIINRLNYHMFKTESHSSRQFGFKEQTSTVAALNVATAKIRQLKSEGNLVAAVSLDIASAFDNAWWPALLLRLQSMKCPRNIYCLVNSYLQDRSVTLNYSDASVSKTTTRGCVQGSVCGPTFWNIILDELLETSLPEGCHIQAFADDVLLIVGAKNVATLQHTTSAALEMITDWGHKVKLNFGPSKTQLIAFTPGAKKANITMGGNTLQFVDHIKILGVIVDSKLKFIQHAKYAISKAIKIYNRLSIFIRPTWGISSENVKIIYQYVVEPIVLYAAGIWGASAASFKCVRDALRSFQRGFAIKAIRGFRTVSATAAIALAGYTPLHLRLEERAEIEKARLEGCTRYLPDDVVLENPVKPAKLLHPSVRRPVNVDFDANPNDDGVSADSVKIFTDGSKTEDKNVGAAFIAYLPSGVSFKRKFKLHNSCSVFQAEMLAIQRACSWIAGNSAKQKYFDATIYSDSMSSLYEIHNPNSTNLFASEIQKIVHLHPRNINFVWVRAHVGLVGNEQADQAAKEAGQSHRALDYNQFPISFVRAKVRADSEVESDRLYQTSQQGSQTRSWCPDLASVRFLLAKVRPGFALTQVLTGHGWHREYLYRFKVSHTDLCPCDNTCVQSMNHLLKHCPRFARKRLDHTQQCNNLRVDPFHLQSILSKESCTDSFIGFIDYIINNLKQFNKI